MSNNPTVVQIIEHAFVALRFGQEPLANETHLAAEAAKRIAALSTPAPAGTGEELPYRCDVCSAPGYGYSADGGNAGCQCFAPPAAEAIKPLEWGALEDGTHKGTSSIGYYHIFPGTGFAHDLAGPVGGPLGTHKRLEAAKAAAQADYEARIRSALIPAPALQGAASESRPQYWKHKRKHGMQYAAKQLHFPDKGTALAWMCEYRPHELDEAMAGWSDEAPLFDTNIWADIPAPALPDGWVRKAARELLEACTAEYGWRPDAKPEDRVSDDPECLITWGHLHRLHVALSAAPALPDGWVMVREIIAAWEALPGGQQSVRRVERWLAEDMKPVIDKARSEVPAAPATSEGGDTNG